MARITITGTPQEVLTKLEAVRDICNKRNDEGWKLFQRDEEWEYIPIYDERLCSICASFAGRWVGERIPVEFNQWRRYHPLRTLLKNEVYPNTHELYNFLHGICRCVLRWADYFYILTERLWREFEEVAM